MVVTRVEMAASCSTASSSSVQDSANVNVSDQQQQSKHSPVNTCHPWFSSTVIALLLFALQLSRASAFPVRPTLLNEVTEQLGWPQSAEMKFQHELEALRALRHHKHKQNWLKEALVSLILSLCCY